MQQNKSALNDLPNVKMLIWKPIQKKINDLM